MSHQVLARKWRPHNFTEIVGQEHVSQSLVNALQHNRLHHAYLFTGTRGVGKTTIARILAKAINCENLQDFNPCGQCASCQAIDEGRFLDLIEVDAASRTKVEDTRDLLDNAQYAPNQAKYKVYLIDEVHMLSGHSFNALLKTLEEPPEHVKFLLATTDPQKIPVTVLSRCLQFNLKRLSPSQISQQMAYILGEEQIPFTEPAIKLLARSADGSMRDGLSLLDQAIVFGDANVNEDVVNNMLGTMAQQPVELLLQLLANSDVVGLLQQVQEISELSPDFLKLLQQMIEILHQLTLAKIAPDFASAEDGELLTELSSLFSAEELQLYYQIALVGQKDLSLAPNPKTGFEMLLLRMLTFNPVKNGVVAAPLAPKPQTPQVTAAFSAVNPIENTKPAPISSPIVVAEQSSGYEWSAIVKALNVSGLTRELANNCILESVDDKVCQLVLDPKQVRTPRQEEKLEAALQNYFAKPIKLIIKAEKVSQDTPAVQIQQAKVDRQQEAVNSIETSDNIQALKTNFDARIIPGSIEPIDKKED
ncbi:MAG: DNA polymerase III subunit gamma/tau [Methyloprofundus sp.]|nr:DNA polymerase III subunit gamma/tau [Methyloprofundus sp.]